MLAPHLARQQGSFKTDVQNIVFDHPESQSKICEISRRRRFIPIIWAHHDDLTYIGRPYTLFANFASLLDQSGSDGFGVIHWMTRRLDIYFASHAKQVWQTTKDEPLDATCSRIAEHMVGAHQQDALARYLLAWITTAPQFARETTPYFIDRPLPNPAQAVAGAEERLRMLDRMNETTLEQQGRHHLAYFKLLEHFILDFYKAHTAFERALAAAEKGDRSTARRELSTANPEKVVEDFSRLARLSDTRGEAGLLISMNLRWLPYFTAARQSLGMEAVRYRFAPTQHDPLALAAGTRTYYIDAQQRFWRTLGERETGATDRHRA